MRCRKHGHRLKRRDHENRISSHRQQDEIHPIREIGLIHGLANHVANHDDAIRHSAKADGAADICKLVDGLLRRPQQRGKRQNHTEVNNCWRSERGARFCGTHCRPLGD
jgi:hypothetical protein